ncbi:MAG TPA: 3-isopropylmalate dehydratase small subunit [Spirochaetaceae bacterium]|nr:3-isopropylmalate dehydratase small subunit [Spirochaetaceae bacterium]
MQQGSKAWKYGDNVDTDVIVPARYLTTSDPAELAVHCMEDLDPDFASQVAQGDIIVAGENFGCGSSREHAPIAIKASGVSCVIAASFARIFYRNAINIGLPILECPQAAIETQHGDMLSVNFESGEIRNLTRGIQYRAAAFPPFVRDIMAAGGLIPYIRQRLLNAADHPFGVQKVEVHLDGEHEEAGTKEK